MTDPIDIVDELHAAAVGWRTPIFHQAAAEIETLRDQVDSLQFENEMLRVTNRTNNQYLLDEIERLRGEGTRWFTAAYRARNGNIIPLGVENTQRGEAEHTVEEFRREDPTGPDYFVATRVQRPWEPVPEGEGA